LKNCIDIIGCKLADVVDYFGEVLDGINKEGESFVFNRDFPS